jgi:ArsR family transcriptional regulator, lead/cadmium/zinc/bismuth-responsive transcriptional repressor
MAIRNSALPVRTEPDTCEIFCYDADKVERVRRSLAGTEGLSQLFKALADETRVRIALALSRDELCVCDVANIMSISVATASHHLRLLKSQGLAKCRKEGKLVFYSLDDDHVVTLLDQAIAHFQEARHK